MNTTLAINYCIHLVDIFSVCSFYETEFKLISHLFYECTPEFWVEVALLIYVSFNRLTPILENMVLFLNYKTDSQSVTSGVQVICLVGKYHIHKYRELQITPNTHLFLY